MTGTDQALCHFSWQDPPARGKRPNPLMLRVAAVLWISLCGPVSAARVTEVLGTNWLALAACGAVAVTAIMAIPARWWIARLLAVAAMTIAVSPIYGERIGLWLGLGTLLALWVVLDRRPMPILHRCGPGSIAPVVVLTGVSAWAENGVGLSWRSLLPFALALAVPFLSALGGGAFERLSKSFGHLVAAALAAVVFSLLGFLVLVTGWVLDRTIRRPPAPPAEGWHHRDRRPSEAGRLWSADAAQGVHSRPRPTAMAAFAVLALLAGGWFAWDQHRSRIPIVIETSGGESASQSWYPEYHDDINWVMNPRVSYRPWDRFRLVDVQTRHVNVRDSHRVSWQPPECDCERFTIWIYGGNGAFGFEQRDEHTIASALARVADDDGIAIDVVNRGFPNQTLWDASIRFAWDVAGQQPPDLVIFYGGQEDLDSANSLLRLDRGDVLAPYESTAEELLDEIAGEPGPPPDVVTPRGWPLASDTPTDNAAELAVRRLERGRPFAVETAAAYDVPILFVWQPSADYPADAGQLANLEAAGALLPTDILDLSSLLDPAVLADGVHPGESGARAVAERIYAHPLVRAATRPPVPGDGAADTTGVRG